MVKEVKLCRKCFESVEDYASGHAEKMTLCPACITLLIDFRCDIPALENESIEQLAYNICYGEDKPK